MKRNPFHLGAIKSVEWFYDRRSQVRYALEMLRDKANIEVTGPRKIGKTWFLRHISHPTTRQAHGIDPRRNICVYIDCQHRSIQQEEDQVYQRMLGCIVETARRVGVDLAPEPHKGPFNGLLAAIGRVFQRRTVTSTTGSSKLKLPPQDSYAPRDGDHTAGMAFERVLKEMHRQGLRTILLLDEFEVIARNPNLDVSFFNHLRALASADDVNVAYVTAASTSLVDLALERESLVGSPFFNIFQPIRLGLFSEQDGRHLVEDTLRRAGTSFPRDLLESVLEVGGRQPFFLQMAGHHAFELAITHDELAEDQHEAFLERVGAEAKRHFEYSWKHLTSPEQYVLATLPFVQDEETYQEQLDTLANLCLIARENSQCEYFSALFRDFVRRQKVENIPPWTAAVTEGERRIVTVLFADVVDFTPMTTRHAEEILTIMKPALRMFVDVVDHHRGEVTNFGGDSIMALFGVPTERPDDAMRAVRAALGIQTSVAAYARELKQRKGVDFSVRVGLDTGVVTVGEIGGTQRAEYTALGDAVNVAQRLEGEAQPGTVVISHRTYQLVRDGFTTESLGPVRVKGKSAPVKAYRVLGEGTDER